MVIFEKIKLYLFIDLLENLDDDDSDIEFNDSEEENSEKDISKKNINKSFKKNKSDDLGSLFASADEFASILDEEPDFMAGTSHAVLNKDLARKLHFFLKFYFFYGNKTQLFLFSRQKTNNLGTEKA